MFLDDEWDGRGHEQAGSHGEIDINQPSRKNIGIRFVLSNSNSFSIMRGKADIGVLAVGRRRGEVPGQRFGCRFLEDKMNHLHSIAR